MKFTFLASKERNEFLNMIEAQWGADCSSWMNEHVFFRNEKNKYFIINRAVDKIPFEQLRVSTLGMYIAEVFKNMIRLSIEGSQLVGALANKNVLEINDAQVKEWILGNDLLIDCKGTDFQIIKHNTDFLGTGKVKNGAILNFVSKERRLQAKAFEE